MKSEYTQSKQQVNYLDQAETITLARHTSLTQANSTMLASKTITVFKVTTANSQKSFMPFMSLRLQTTGNELTELNDKMTELIKDIELTSFKFEEEDYRNESLKLMKTALKE